MIFIICKLESTSVITRVWTLVQNECLSFLRIDPNISVCLTITGLSCTATLSFDNCFSLLKEKFQLSDHKSGKEAAKPL